jgi:hypothetical protein
MGDGNICKIYFCFKSFVFSHLSAVWMSKFYNKNSTLKMPDTTFTIFTLTFFFSFMMEHRKNYISTNFKG